MTCPNCGNLMESEKDYDYHNHKRTSSENFLCGSCGYEARIRGGAGNRPRKTIVIFDPRTQDGDYYEEGGI